MYRVIRFTDVWTDRLLVLVFIIMLLIGGYTVYDNWYVYSHASDKSLLAYKPSEDKPTEDVLGELSKDAIAWLTFPDTSIDYPIMQGKDNLAYLNTDPYGNYSLSGSIFLDSRNSPDFTDEYSLLYGHHMDTGQMFGCLDKYLNKDFFDSHQDAILIFGGKEHHVHIFAVTPADASEAVTFNPPLSEGILEYIDEYAVHYDGSKPERLIGFSTCLTESVTSRLIVFGFITD